LVFLVVGILLFAKGQALATLNVSTAATIQAPEWCETSVCIAIADGGSYTVTGSNQGDFQVYVQEGSSSTYSDSLTLNGLAVSITNSVSGSGLVDVTSAELTLAPNAPGSYVFTYTDTAGTDIVWPFTVTYSVPTITWTSYVTVNGGTPEPITAASVIDVLTTSTVAWEVVVGQGASSVTSVTVTCIAAKGSCPYGAIAMSQTAAGTWTSGSEYVSYPAGSYTISATISGPTVPSPGLTAFSVLLPIGLPGALLSETQALGVAVAAVGAVVMVYDQRKTLGLES
jgi:hypothetical protein